MTSPYRDPLGEEELERIAEVESDEDFDRIAFARRALDLVSPARTRVVLCPGSRQLRLDTGRAWGKRANSHPSATRWAVFWVPARASRRAIALAALELAEGTSSPYALDALMAHAQAG